MVQIGNVPEIVSVKACLITLQEQEVITAWELPYENLLTRLTAAIFYFSLEKNVQLSEIQNMLQSFGTPVCEENKDTLSDLSYRLTFLEV